MITAIIPAYNEEKNIAAVIRAFKQSPLISEIIVVNDGSTDMTGDAAKAEGARVINQDNKGKAAAMAAGAAAASDDIIFFADADLLGFTVDHIRDVIAPVQDGRAGMSVGIRGWGVIPLWIMQHVLPVIGGERALRRDDFLALSSHPAAKHFGIETVMNAYCKKHSISVILVRMYGVSQIRKEQKYGFRKGFRARVRMFAEIIKTEIALIGDRTL